MSEHKSHPSIDLSEAKQSSEYLKQETQKEDQSDVIESKPDLTHEQKAENETAHEQNITAHIPGGSAIADINNS